MSGAAAEPAGAEMAEQELTESQEMYLKAIFSLSSGGNQVRLSDIARHLGVSKPSVTGALRQLADKGFVNHSRYEAVTLTRRGDKAAREVAARFEVLLSFMIDVLNIPRDKAYRAACDMEHALPTEVRDRLVKFLEYMGSCPRGPASWSGAEQGFVCGAKRDAACRRQASPD